MSTQEKPLFDEVNEVYALARGVQSVIDHHSLNSSEHPLWALVEMLVERLDALSMRAAGTEERHHAYRATIQKA